MKIFSRIASSFLAVGLISTAARGDTGECSVEGLPDAAVEQLNIYDKDVYLEPNCVNGFTPVPIHCNYLDLGQECRGCFLTCDGAMEYMADFVDEIAVWGEDAVINFCPGAEVDDLDGCYNYSFHYYF